MTEESKVEIKKLLGSRNYYVGIDGRMSFSASNDVVNLILNNILS